MAQPGRLSTCSSRRSTSTARLDDCTAESQQSPGSKLLAYFQTWILCYFDLANHQPTLTHISCFVPLQKLTFFLGHMHGQAEQTSSSPAGMIAANSSHLATTMQSRCWNDVWLELLSCSHMHIRERYIHGCFQQSRIYSPVIRKLHAAQGLHVSLQSAPDALLLTTRCPTAHYKMPYSSLPDALQLTARCPAAHYQMPYSSLPDALQLTNICPTAHCKVLTASYVAGGLKGAIWRR